MKRHRVFDVQLPVAAIESDDGAETAASSGGIVIVVRCRVLFRYERSRASRAAFTSSYSCKAFALYHHFSGFCDPPYPYGCCIDID